MTLRRIMTIPRGDAGIMATVRQMRRMVREAETEPLTVETAGFIVGHLCCPSERAQAIRDFLAANVRYVPDPLGSELLRTPDYMLRQIQTRGHAEGDCDDVATLGAALGRSVGMPARFVLLGFSPATFDHVFTELLTPEGWAELDTTAPMQMPEGLRVHRSHTVEV